MSRTHVPHRETTHERRLAWVVAVVAATTGGLLLGLTMPRGPVVAWQALTAMAVGAGVGFVVGASLRSRWALLLAPIVFVTAFEVIRVGAVGPTVDAPRATMLGLLALLLGRGFDGLIMLLPMMLGATLGTAWIRRREPSGTTSATAQARGRGLLLRRSLTGLTTIGVALLAVGLAWPASTDPIPGPDGQPLATSIAELTTVRIGDHEQALMIRGHRADAPVLLWLAGGPGGSDIGAMRKAGQQLETAFVVVTWDQRGAGKTFAAIEPTETMTLDQAVDDTLAVTRYLRDRFGQDRIYLAGNSWGTIPSVLAAQRHPEWFHAFVGAGQMVDPFETDALFYEDTLAYAREQGDRELEAALREAGPPPYDHFLDYAPAVFAPGGELLWNDYPRIPGSTANSEMPGTLFVSEYTLLEKVRTAGATFDTMEVLYPDLRNVDLRHTARHLDVPVRLVQGRHEARGRAVLVDDWFEQLDAPHKEMTVFEGSGHRPMFEEPERFFEVMTDVLDGTR